MSEEFDRVYNELSTLTESKSDEPINMDSYEEECELGFRKTDITKCYIVFESNITEDEVYCIVEGPALGDMDDTVSVDINYHYERPERDVGYSGGYELDDVKVSLSDYDVKNYFSYHFGEWDIKGIKDITEDRALEVLGVSKEILDKYAGEALRRGAKAICADYEEWIERDFDEHPYNYVD